MQKRLGEKPIEIWNFWENLKIYMQKSQWKSDFLSIFSHFPGLFHFIHPCNIPKFLGVALGGTFRRAWTENEQKICHFSATD